MVVSSGANFPVTAVLIAKVPAHSLLKRVPDAQRVQCRVPLILPLCSPPPTEEENMEGGHLAV